MRAIGIVCLFAATMAEPAAGVTLTPLQGGDGRSLKIELPPGNCVPGDPCVSAPLTDYPTQPYESWVSSLSSPIGQATQSSFIWAGIGIDPNHMYGEGTAQGDPNYPSADSNFIASFSIDETTMFSLWGSLDRTYPGSTAEVGLCVYAGGYCTSSSLLLNYVLSPATGGDHLDFGISGALPQGAYTLFAVASSTGVGPTPASFNFQFRVPEPALGILGILALFPLALRRSRA